jgi:hypothetical protein
MFSLAGAQPKTALLLQNDRWGIPSGRIPDFPESLRAEAESRALALPILPALE